jgi:EAL domain-containing protein (putative c-di-GMP-specific phosphodiesterase class I)
VIDLLRRKEVDPALLDLEVTEGALAINPEIVLRRLEELRDMGVGLALDDFGTGFSSLSYVSQFPFTSIKIDRSFVSSLISSAKDRQVALVAISLGQNLHLKTIAEGVEDEATVQELLELECDIGQGYLFGRAMPLDEFNQWMASKAMSAALADS